MKDARTEALIANWKIQELKHQLSRFRDRAPGGFRKASTLQDWTEMESEKDKLQKLHSLPGAILDLPGRSSVHISEKRERNIQTKQITDEEGCETVSNGLKRKTSCFRRFFG